MVLAFKGRKSSSSSKKATRHDDNLFGTDTVEVLLALGEGPVKGWKRGAADFYVGDVPLLDAASSTPNISNFELRLLKGTDPADSIRLNLGGTASTKNVGLELRTPGQMINVQGDKTQIDFIDFRFLVQRLLSANDDGGEFPTDISFKIEVKRRSSSVWEVPFSNETPPDEDTSGASSYRPGVTTPGSVVNGAYRETYVQANAPTAGKAVGAMWFNTDRENWRPSIWNGAGWVEPSNLSSELRSGLPVWTWIDFDGAIRSAWFSAGGVVPPPGTLAAGDFLITPQSGEQIYSYNDTAWVGFQSWASPAVVAPGVISFNGLTRSSYPKEFRVPVARINEPYDMRVTRLTAASTKNVFADIQFESIQEVNRDPVEYPNLAIAWLTIKATDTFTSIPEFTSVLQGLVIPVPSNCYFNETTKIDEYVGLWDGSFKMAYTNSPGWHAYNFIMNARYGKNSYYPEVADRWDFYNFSRHCALHKIRFNEYITEARPLNELINYIVGTAGGRYIDRGDGYSSVLWDADDQPAVAIFAPENTVEGSFTYSFTDVTERKNDFKVSFKNPELNYREDRLRVYDQNSIDVYGRNAEEFVAVGCRDSEEAVRRGRLRLATALTECIIVNFKTNRLGRYLTPFQVILIADDQSTNVISGRVLNPDTLPAGTVRLPLRDQIYLEASVDYSASFTLSDGNGGLKVVTYPIDNSTPGQQSVLKLAQALSEPLPEYAVFSIGAPKAFRVTSIVEADDDKDSIDITAIEVNRQKWAFVDGLVELRDILAVQTGPLSKYVYPVTNARIFPQITLDGHYNLVVAWNPSETKLIRGYRLYQSINNGPMNLLAEPSDTQYVISDAVAGTYIISIVAVGLDGTTESPPVTVQYIVSNTGSLRSVAPPTNLRLVNEPDSPIFHAVDPAFAWDAAADPLVARYLVEVLSSTRVVHTTRTEGLGFNYPLAANTADNGGTPLRQFTVRVRSIDTAGNLSAPAALVVSHPAPAAVIPSLVSANSAILVSFNPSTADYQGALTFIEKSSIPVPPTTPPKADSKNPTVFYSAETGVRYYVRVALYDSYGKTGLNYSEEQSIVVRDSLIDVVAPVIPTAPVLTTKLVKGEDGKVSATVRAEWTANPSQNFGYFDTRARLRGTGDWTYYSGGIDLAQTWEGLPIAVLFEVQVRAWNKDGFAVSGWSPSGSVITAPNNVAPGNVTNLSVNTTIQTAFLRWQIPNDNDLAYVEIYASDVDDPNAPSVMKVPAPGNTWQDTSLTAAGGQRLYWARAFNSSGIGSPLRTGPVRAVSKAIEAGQLATDAITSSLTAQGLETIGVARTALPPVLNYTGPSTITFQGRLYTIREGAWKPLYVNAAELVGALTADQQKLLDLANLTGKITKTQVGDEAIDTPQLRAGAVVASKIGAGEIVTSHLSIASTNLIYNANGKILKANGYQSGAFADAGNSGSTIYPGQRGDNTFAGTEPFYIRPATNSPTAGSYGQIFFRRPKETADPGYKGHFPVQAGVRYEVSAYFSTYDCEGQLYVDFYGNADVNLGRAITTYAPLNARVQRIGGFFTVPAGVTNVNIQAIAYWTGGGNPHLFVSAPMLAPVSAKQTELSPFVEDGLTVMDGASLVTGSVNARVLNATEIFADRAVINAATIGILTAGAIKAGMLDSGVVTTETLAVSSQAGNLVWNSDFLAGAPNVFSGGAYSGATAIFCGYNNSGATWQPPGMGSAVLQLTGTITGYADMSIRWPVAGGGYDDMLPCIPNQKYEISGYFSTHRCRAYALIVWYDANRNYITEASASVSPFNYQSSGVLSNWFRSGGFSTSPSNAAFVRFIVRSSYQNGGTSDNPYTFVTGLYLARANKNQTEYSVWAAQASTIIRGDQVATGSINASAKITAGSIVTDLFTAGTIDAKILNVDTLYARVISSGWVTADVLQVGGGDTLRSVINGGSSTKIQGGAIAANTITANLLKIGSRGIQTVDIEFYIERDGNGNLTNVMAWTAGYVLFTNTSNAQQSAYVPAGRVGIDGGYWYIWWCLRTPDAGFYSGKDNWAAIQADQDNVMMASVAGITGLTVFGGAGTIIDGTRITTRSITANQIAVNTLTADLIQAGTVFSQRLYLGGRTVNGVPQGTISLEGDNSRIYITNIQNNATRVVIGNIAPWVGNDPSGYPKMGLLLWNEQNQLILGAGGITKEALIGWTTTGNILFNSTFELGPDGNAFNVPGWALGGNNGAVEFQVRRYPDGYGFRGSGGTLTTQGSDGSGGGGIFAEVCSRTSKGERYPASAGQRWEASAYVNTHRSNMEVYIGFYNYLGQAISYVTSGQSGATNIGAAQYISQFRRIGVFATAPGGTEFVDMFVRNTSIGEASPYMFMVQPYLGQCAPNQNEFSPWSPGAQTLSIDASNISSYIKGAIIDTAYITDAAIKNAKISNLEVDNAKIANLTVGNGKIADYQITTWAGSESGGNEAGVPIRLRAGKFLIHVLMSGAGGQATLASTGYNPGSLRVEAGGDNFGRKVVKDMVIPLTMIYLPGNGGNHFYTPAFGYSFFWDGQGAMNYSIYGMYTGNLPNAGVAIYVTEVSK